ncbi:regulatory protein spx [Enterococcus pernyi]
MIIVYTESANASCRQVIHWFQDEEIPYLERRVNEKKPLTKKELGKLMSLTTNGFDDLLRIRSKFYNNMEIKFEDMSYEEAISLLINNTELLKKPIIVDLETNKIEVGFNEEKIRIFLPRSYKDIEKNYYKKKSLYLDL